MHKEIKSQKLHLKTFEPHEKSYYHEIPCHKTNLGKAKKTNSCEEGLGFEIFFELVRKWRYLGFLQVQKP